MGYQRRVHGGCRIAYMAQLAFHHLEEHLDKSATQYVLNRFAGGEDTESLEYLASLGATKATDEEKVKNMKWKDGSLIEVETFYNDKGELEYQKKDLDKAVALDQI